MIAQFERFSLRLTKEQALGASHPGDCSEDISRLMLVKGVTNQLAALDPQQLRDELAEYGPWANGDLEDEYLNKRRIIWIAACNIREELNSRRRV